jgi:hypothetical protein
VGVGDLRGGFLAGFGVFADGPLIEDYDVAGVVVDGETVADACVGAVRERMEMSD